MSYVIKREPRFDRDIAVHIKSGRKSILIKINALVDELREHPTTGTGNPEQLGYKRKGQWSRHITHKHRLIYEIQEDVVTVF